MTMPNRPITVDYYVDSQGKWRWRFTSNGRIMGDSGQGYATKASAKRGWQRIVEATAAGLVREAE